VDTETVDEAVAAWCRRWLRAEPEEVLFRAGYLSAVTGLRLADGRQVVVKARPPVAQLHGCVAVQAALAAAVRARLAELRLPSVVGHADWESQNLLTAYAQARGRPWTDPERQACWAAGLWVRAFNAKKERMEGGGPQLDQLATEAPERSARAGLDV
jgi:hypothetical protein